MKKRKISTKIEEVDDVSAEVKRLSSLFEHIDNDHKSLCQDLIQNAAFMSVSLRTLQDDIKINGWVEEYQNGEFQSGRKPSSTANVYNKLISNYNMVIKQLIALLPDSEKENAEKSVDPMTDFLMSK
ncbi:MAG: hypothetical protein LKF53_02155 [Solobacterium sp.]|jgi:hypothetical protein|nr:hypothetical protein [Solobacterium sp.]MCH4226774.1 hypothetical protein [Solobacterium sp.]MCH4281897.1 hypothetical protein [Solobacterium sp.]